MDRNDVQVGSTITNEASAIRVTERVEKDPRWKTSGWRGIVIPLEEFGNRGMSSFVPDYLLDSWHHLPFEWRALPGDMEERYVWADGWRWLNREVRVRREDNRPVRETAFVFPRKKCNAMPVCQEAHLWQETRIPTGNPLVEHSQWWQCGEPDKEVSA